MSEFIIYKRDGRFKNIKVWKEYTNKLPDGNYRVKVTSAKQRSLLQNDYYWAVMVPLVYEGLRDAGFDAIRTKEDAHLVLRSLFLKVTEQKGDIKIEKILSTTDLTTMGFAEFIQNVQVWALDYLNVNIPSPNEQLSIV